MPLRSRSWLALLLVLSLSGCMTSMFLNNLDWFVIRYFNQYMDLSQEQKSIVSAAVEEGGSALAERELPQLLDILDDLSAANEKQRVSPANQEQRISEEQGVFTERLEALGRGVGEHFRSYLVALAMSVSPEQRESIREYMDEENEEYREENVDKDEATLRKQLRKDVVKASKEWLGRLNDEQEGLIDDYVGSYSLDDEAWLMSRMSWQKALLSALKVNDQARRDALAPLIDDPEAYFSDEYLRLRDLNKPKGDAFIAAMFESADERQRRSIDKEIASQRKKILAVQAALLP